MPLDIEKVRSLCNDFTKWAEKMERLREEMNEATGEAKMAYSVVYNDYQWKMTNKVGQLWFYLCGTVSHNPFEDSETAEMPALEKVD